MYSIVLADDERLELEMLKNFVPWEKLGFQVVGTAKNGREALARVGDLMPDVVLTDVKMPLMDGVEFARIARGLLPRLQIVFLSGHDDFAYVKSALQVEAVGYLLKPLNLNELIELMEKVKTRCIAERRVKLSSRALAVQYVKDLLREEQPLMRKNKAEEIRSLDLKSLRSASGRYAYSLITIDEYPTLTKYVENGAAIAAGIADAVERLADTHEALLVPIDESRRLAISVREPLQDALQWYEELASLTQRITFCSSSRQAPLEEVFEVYRELLHARNRHVLRYGTGQFIVADSADDDSADAGGNRPAEAPLPAASLHAYIRQGQADDALRYVSAFFSELTESLNESIKPLEQACMALLDQLYAELVTPYAAIRKQIEDKSAVFGRLSYIESAPVMEQTIRGVVLALAEAMSGLETDKHEAPVRQVRSLIEAECARPLTIEYLAERVFMSPNYLRTIFKERTGSTVLEYVTQVRLDRASELLRESTMKVNDIAAKVGYENASHFCAVFLKKKGLTPNQYRTRNAKP